MEQLTMSKTCFTCRHCYKGQLCTLFDELIEHTLSCFMWSDRE